MSQSLRHLSHRLHGIHAATVTPLDDRRRLHEADLAAHLGRVAGTPGIRGVLVNGHAGEGPLLEPAEKRRVVELARATVAPAQFVCAGVSAESTAAAQREAEAAAAAGADGILVFPPFAWALGHDTEMVVAHHAAIAAACGLPLVLYRAPISAGRLAYSLDSLAALAALPAVIAVKEGSWEVAAYEEVRRMLNSVAPRIAVLGSGDEHLLTSYLIGSEGSQVSLAAIVPELIVALFDAAAAGAWARARALHERIYPLAVAIYRRQPAYLATVRLKACLHQMGRICEPLAKLPMRQLRDDERQDLVGALRQTLEGGEALASG
ncbi:MAG: dihydrodipicolinate synthase family protein [Roseovarius sp.]